MIEVVRVCDRLMMALMVVGKVTCKVISAYAPQAGVEEEDKVEFFDRLSDLMLRVKDKEWVIVGGDFNGHVGEGSGDFRGMHGGYGVGRRNAEGVRLLEFCEEHELSVVNTFFRKAERHQITYRSPSPLPSAPSSTCRTPLPPQSPYQPISQLLQYPPLPLLPHSPSNTTYT